jgi:hypothetical protein
MEFYGWISSIRNTELEIQNHDNRARQLKKPPHRKENQCSSLLHLNDF